MSFFVWKTSIQCKLNDIKTDIVGSHRERETNRYIRKTKQEANPSIVTTKERLEYYLKKKYNLIYIEGELYHEMEQKDYKKILNSFENIEDGLNPIQAMKEEGNLNICFKTLTGFKDSVNE